MATRSKTRRRKWRKTEAAPSPPAKEAKADAPPEESAESKPTEEKKADKVIRKGIYLSALVYVEGEMPAPDDFMGPATKSLKSVLGEALKGEHSGLSMSLKKVVVRHDIEQDGEEEGVGEQKDQF